MASCLGVTAGISGLAGCMNTDKSDNDKNGASDELLPSEWPMYGVDPQNTGYHPTATGPTNENVESNVVVETEGSIRNSPIIVEGTLYVSSSDGNFYSYDLDKEELNSEKVINSLHDSHPAFKNDRIFVGIKDGIVALDRDDLSIDWEYNSAISNIQPTPVPNGIIGTENMFLHRFDSRGNKTTIHNMRDHSGGRPYSKVPAVNNNRVYFTSGIMLYAVNPKDGEIEWSFENPNEEIMGECNPAISDGSVYVGGEDQQLYSINSINGTKEWSIDTKSVVPSDPSVANGIVYVEANGSAYLGGDSWLLAIDINKQEIVWEQKLTSTTSSKPVIVDGSVYHVDLKTIYSFDAEKGHEIWKSEVFEEPASVSPVVFDNDIYASAADGNVYKIS
ncbi:Pyrrolo-quinoline quinone [Natrinema versiforme JCM 10478]|uniref:Pyrrolo-quinoline quinone n=2 Tax=Natrinema versiforme TaxID=88724 RepID=L9Y4B7_9EURY|nr:Pyrrolo-quinoline quinone [Natrinema versiforme JCM 10478]